MRISNIRQTWGATEIWSDPSVLVDWWLDDAKLNRGTIFFVKRMCKSHEHVLKRSKKLPWFPTMPMRTSNESEFMLPCLVVAPTLERLTVVQLYNSKISDSPYGGFLKWWYPTTMGVPTKNDHFGVFWGYRHLRKHPYASQVVLMLEVKSSFWLCCLLLLGGTGCGKEG